MEKASKEEIEKTPQITQALETLKGATHCIQRYHSSDSPAIKASGPSSRAPSPRTHSPASPPQSSPKSKPRSIVKRSTPSLLPYKTIAPMRSGGICRLADSVGEEGEKDLM
ncbi:hypothetical protein E2542_SST15525 [Spatholobus suberectus]|nr:hypothetical protein E2542_SST15525 [Spatholobus suberectus]